MVQIVACHGLTAHHKQLMHPQNVRSIRSTQLRSCSVATRVARGRSGMPVTVRNDNVLIINTKGGGHAFIGLYLARELMKKGHKVSILNDGDANKLRSKGPYQMYGWLEERGARIVFGDPASPSTYPRDSFDVVYDNNGKDMDACKPSIDHFRSANLKHYVFVASAGAYVPSHMEPGHWEGDLRKASAGHVEVEKYLGISGLPWTVFQPLYIYGEFNAKDCEQWFLDRIMRDRPIPIPAPGLQLTSMTHVEDVASMLAAVPGNHKAIGQSYNVCSDRTYTFDGVCRILAKAAGKEAKIVHYNPKDFSLKKGEGFPFRAVHFFADSTKAKVDLGWQPAHSLQKDAKALVEEYVKSGRVSKSIDFAVDDRILAQQRAYA